MATRLTTRDEKLATLKSVMNVITLLDHDSPPRSFAYHTIDLRRYLEEATDEFIGPDDDAIVLNLTDVFRHDA